MQILIIKEYPVDNNQKVIPVNKDGRWLLVIVYQLWVKMNVQKNNVRWEHRPWRKKAADMLPIPGMLTQWQQITLQHVARTGRNLNPKIQKRHQPMWERISLIMIQSVIDPVKKLPACIISW